MKRFLPLFTLIVLLFTALFFWSFTNQNPDENDSRDINAEHLIGSRYLDLQGNIHRVGVENKRAYPVALVFVDVGCIITQRMIPEMNRLYRQAKQQEVKFYGVISNPKVKWKEAVDFKKEYAIQFPILFDANGDLANRLKPEVVPECYVFDIYDELIYYGRINDQYKDIGKFNAKIRSSDLEDAMIAVANGKAVSNKHQAAKGCIFESWDKPGRKITFNRDIDPIIQSNCASCHRPNDIGPFSLQSYDDAFRRARMITYVTQKGYMPIWKAKAGHGKFSNEHRLSDYQIDLIQQWVNSGMEEGSSEEKMEIDKRPADEWKLGEPDVIVKMDPYDLPASGEDQYRVFVMKDVLPKGKVIRAVDFKAGDQSVVHHSTIFVDYSGKLRQYDAEDPESGYDAFEKGGTMEFGGGVPICGWAPGVGPYAYPNNVGFYVEENADLAFENHYHLSGKATTDQSYIGIYFADEAPEKYITGSIMGTQKLQIAADEANYTKSVWTYVPADIELFDLTPHMHYIGKEVKVEVLLPDGNTMPLLHVDDWDLRWQSVYTLRELTLIPKGSIIKADFVYDNSEDNHDNPYYPPQEMYWGWGSNDEMCEVYFSYVPLNNGDYGKMIAASLASFEHFYPPTDRVVVTVENLQAVAQQYAAADLWSKEGQILLYSLLEASLAEQAAAYLVKQKGKYRADRNYQINLAQLKLTEAYFSFDERKMYAVGEEAAQSLYTILLADETNWNASFSYAVLLMGSGSAKDMKDGAKVLKELIDYQEQLNKEDKFYRSYWELGKYYYSLKNDEQAEEILKRGLKQFPDHPDLRQELDSDGRIVKKTLN